MQFSPVVFVLGLAAAVQAWGGNGTVVYTTITTDFYTTVCPSPTTFVAGNSTYTVTESTTLTITNCPCTISAPITTTSAPYYFANSTSTISVASTGIVPPPFSSPPSVTISGSPSTTTGPAGFTANAAPVKEVSYGAIAVAGLAAVFL